MYILTQSRENDEVFNIMEADGFYNYTGSFLFSQVFFEIIKKDLPAFSEKGRITMSSEKSIYIFPNGQGGVFPAMKSADIFNHMYRPSEPRKSNGVEYIHFVSSENIHHLPGDAELLGYAAMNKCDVTVKAYLNDNYVQSHPHHPDQKYLVKNEQGHFVTAKKEELLGKLTNPALAHTVNCIIRADLFQNKDFKSRFNYMQK